MPNNEGNTHGIESAEVPSSQPKSADLTVGSGRLGVKKFTLNILNGVALGTVVALIPNALLSELFKALLPVFPAGQYILNAAILSQGLLSALCGFVVALLFNFTPIQIGSIALATVMGSGVLVVNDAGDFVMRGTGDIINVAVTAAFAVGVVKLLGNRLKAYAILLVPPVVLLVGGGLGTLTLPYIRQITTAIGYVVSHLSTLQPVPMGIVISVVFSILIVTPVSSVAVALAISLAGVAAGAGNLGVCAAAFGLAICGWRVNSLGTNLAHFIGSPKIQMANVFERPKIMLPIICNAAVLGVVSVIFDLKGTPHSAGFGFSGLIGPVNALNLADGGWSFTNLLIIGFSFAIAPITLGICFNWLFSKVFKIVKAEDYLIVFK